MAVPSAVGGHHVGAEQRHTTGALQPPGEVHILHDRNVGKPAKLREDLVLNEERLIAGGDAAPARPQTDQPRDQPGEAPVAFEPHVETPSDAGGIVQRPFDSVPGLVGQVRVGVEEKQDVRLAVRRAGVHLPGAAGLGRKKHDRSSSKFDVRSCKRRSLRVQAFRLFLKPRTSNLEPERHGNVASLIAAAAVHDNNVVKSKRGCALQRLRQRLLLVQRGDDDGDLHGWEVLFVIR